MRLIYLRLKYKISNQFSVISGTRLDIYHPVRLRLPMQSQIWTVSIPDLHFGFASPNEVNSMAHDNLDYGNTGDQIHDENMEDSQLTYVVGNSKIYSKGIDFAIQQTNGQSKFERFYRSVYIAVERRPTDPNVEKEELFFLVDTIYNQVLKLEGFTSGFDQLGRSLKQLFSLAPDVFQVCVTILSNPSSDLSPALVSYVEQVREDCEPGAQMNMPINSYLEMELMDHQLPPDKSDEMRADLNELQAAVNVGNVRPVRQLIDELIAELPGMRMPLRNWLVESAEIPAAIKVFARKYL